MDAIILTTNTNELIFIGFFVVLGLIILISTLKTHSYKVGCVETLEFLFENVFHEPDYDTILEITKNSKYYEQVHEVREKSWIKYRMEPKNGKN